MDAMLPYMVDQVRDGFQTLFMWRVGRTAAAEAAAAEASKGRGWARCCLTWWTRWVLLSVVCHTEVLHHLGGRLCLKQGMGGLSSYKGEHCIQQQSQQGQQQGQPTLQGAGVSRVMWRLGV
jgi:hypothetical protein